MCTEVELENDDDYENVEQTLLNFLETEMQIYSRIEFHRVHRLGRPDKTSEEPKPRPIIAKFERFKDREFVRSKAPQTLKNKQFGVREQYPKVIEDQRKLLYPEAKKARQNEENKVRMVRDKLFVNDIEVVVQPKEPVSNDTNETRRKSQTSTYRRETTRSDFNNVNRRDRVFYRGGRKTFSQRMSRQTDRTRTLDFSVPTSNRYATLADYVDTPVQERRDRPVSKKHPASSPLDEQHQVHKKHRDGSNSDSDSSEEAASTSFQRDSQDKTPETECGSSGAATLSDTQISMNSTITTVPDIQWSAISTGNDSENRQSEYEQTENNRQGERDQTVA